MQTTSSEAAARGNGDWRACDGEIGRLVHHLRWRKRAGRIRLGVLVALLGTVTLAWQYYSSEVAKKIDVAFAGSPCDLYMAQMRAFYCEHSQTRLLNSEILAHLEKCPDCRKSLALCRSISQRSVAQVSARAKNAQAPATKRPISLDDILNGATLASGR